MVELNKYKLFISFLIGMYSISNVFIYFNTSYKYQVKQINYLYSLLDETNNNYNRINKQYQILNKKYDKLNEDIIKLNHTINTINQICSEEKVCEEKVCESNINHDFIEKICLDLNKVDKILQDYEKVDAPVLNYKINDIYPNPNNSIVKMFYTFF
jgi:hypothetical protein